jgi:AcrR family transcriptional regulator
MSTETQRRPYNKKRRAELEHETRLRITESAVALHGSLGPSRTSISAVAEHAGVRRSTVYRHFPDEAALFAACTSHWAQENPPPNLWIHADVEDPDERARLVLRDLYRYYRGVEQMMVNSLRDEAAMPVVQQALGPYHAMLGAVRELLMTGRRGRGRARERTEASIGHALAFPTWRSLAREQGLDDESAADLMTRLVIAAA